MTATLGTFDVAATVDGVFVQGASEKNVTLSSPHLSALNRQLQFVTYTNTVFNPKTADTGKSRVCSEASAIKHNTLFIALVVNTGLFSE